MSRYPSWPTVAPYMATRIVLAGSNFADEALRPASVMCSDTEEIRRSTSSCDFTHGTPEGGAQKKSDLFRLGVPPLVVRRHSSAIVTSRQRLIPQGLPAWIC